MTAETPKTEKLYTYQDLAPMFQVHEKTVARWFRGRKIFRPNNSTARVTQSQLDLFIQESGKKLKVKK